MPEVRLVLDTASLDAIQVNLMSVIKQMRQFMESQTSLQSQVSELFETLDDSLSKEIRQVCREETKKAFEKAFINFLVKMKE